MTLLACQSFTNSSILLFLPTVFPWLSRATFHIPWKKSSISVSDPEDYAKLLLKK
jgi:hypothetical protein